MSKQPPDDSERPSKGSDKGTSDAKDAPSSPGQRRKAPQPVKVQTDLADVPEYFSALWSRLADKMVGYFSRALLLMVGVVIVFTAAWGIGQWMELRREKATEVLGRAIRIGEADLLRDTEKPDADADPPRFKTAQERTDAVVKVLDELDKEYGSSDAARRGSLLRAGMLYDQGKFPEAEALYRRFIEKKDGQSALLAVAYEGLGLCAEAKNDANAAITAYEQQATEPFARERGRMNQARVYVKQGNKQKATEVYKDLLAKAAPQSPLRDDVQNRLAALEP